MRSRSNLRYAIKGIVVMYQGYKYQACILNGYWFMDIYVSIIFVIMGTINFDSYPEMRSQ